MDLTTVARVLQSFYRLVGVTPDDPGLIEQGEAENDVAYLFLTRGSRAAQRWMLKSGYGGWRKRSAALSWTGSDAVDGGRYATLPDDFLRAYGNERRSALVEAGGNRWGTQINPDEDDATGNGYYIRGEQIWLTRKANPPATLYLDYHYRHPVWASAITIDFPLEARGLIVAEAANAAKEESWLPGDQTLETKIASALRLARAEALDVSRPTKQARTLRKPTRRANRW